MSVTGHLDNAGSSSLPCVSVADLCSTICVCLLEFFFFFFLESLEMYYAVLGFFGFIFLLS